MLTSRPATIARPPVPHLVILYAPNLEAEIGMTSLCRQLADTMLK